MILDSRTFFPEALDSPTNPFCNPQRRKRSDSKYEFQIKTGPKKDKKEKGQKQAQVHN